MSQQPKNSGSAEPMRAILLGFGGRADVVREADRLRPIVEQQVRIVATDFSGAADMSKAQADLAIVLGGDGSILRAAHQMGNHQLPVVAVNLGRLGFLADILPDELPRVLAEIQAGKTTVAEYLMLECEVVRNGEVLCRQLGLNEVAVEAGPPFAILDVDLYVDAEPVTAYSCDGLIISTPVGSTAHNLSAGGPILRQDLQAFVISPISPHTLTYRPVVDSADRVYELVVPRPNPATSVVVDGHVLCTLESQDRVRVSRAPQRFKMVVAPGHSYYRTLREKLGWSGRLQTLNGPR